MKRFQPLLAKESGRSSGGMSAHESPVAVASAPAAGLSHPVSECPFGVPVTLRSAAGEEAVGIRSEYQPNWLDANRDQPLPFTPVSFSKP